VEAAGLAWANYASSLEVTSFIKVGRLSAGSYYV